MKFWTSTMMIRRYGIRTHRSFVDLIRDDNRGLSSTIMKFLSSLLLRAFRFLFFSAVTVRKSAEEVIEAADLDRNC
jgi:hypothetical protein